MNKYSNELNWIALQKDFQKVLLEKWVSMNSYSWNTEGLHVMADEILSAFRSLGASEEVIQLPPHHTIERSGDEKVKSLGPLIHLVKRPEAKVRVLLAGHMDTVYSPSDSFKSLSKVSDTLWKGPGCADMKGGLIILLTALLAFERFPGAERIGWDVLINPDEEIGSPGSKSYFQSAAKRHQVGLLFEPAFPDGSIVHSRKGSANFSCTFKGKAAHAGRDFNLGCSAIYAMSEWIYHVESLNTPQKGIIVNVGYVEGGGPVNIVPDYAHCRLTCRATSRNDLESVYQQLLSIAEKVGSRTGIHIELHNETWRNPKPCTQMTQEMIDAFGSCAGMLDLSLNVKESGGVCDGNDLAEAGLPTLDSLGCIGGHLHSSEEYIYLPSLTERAQLTTLFLMRLADETIKISEQRIPHV